MTSREQAAAERLRWELDAAVGRATRGPFSVRVVVTETGRDRRTVVTETERLRDVDRARVDKVVERG